MFNMGIGEVIIIAIIALVVLGPEKFPVFAKTALRTFRDMRGYFEEVKGEVVKELNPISKDLKQLKRYNPEDYIESFAKTLDSEKDAADKRSADEKTGEKTDTAAAPEPAKDEQPSSVPGTEARSDSPYSD